MLDLRDFNTETWARLREYLEAELARLRARNDDNLSDLETASLRGEIRRIKTLLALDKRPGNQPPLTLIADEKFIV